MPRATPRIQIVMAHDCQEGGDVGSEGEGREDSGSAGMAAEGAAMDEAAVTGADTHPGIIGRWKGRGSRHLSRTNAKRLAPRRGPIRWRMAAHKTLAMAMAMTPSNKLSVSHRYQAFDSEWKCHAVMIFAIPPG